MKGRLVWGALAAGLLALVAVRVSAVRQANKAGGERLADAAVIRVAKVSRAELAQKVSLTGTIRPRNEVDIVTKVPGRIETLAAQVGDRVRAGQTLATVEHREIAWQARSAQASVDVARANLDGAKLDYDRTVTLHKGGSAAQAQLDGAKLKLALAQAQAAQAQAAAGLAEQQLANSRVDCPISGTVTRRPVNVGAYVGPATALFTVQDVATLKLEASVDPASFSRLQKGGTAAVRVDELPDQAFEGKLTLLSPSLDAQTRRAAVEMEIDNASGKLLPNMFARAELTVGRLQNALAVPKDAVLEQPGGAVVFRVSGDRVQAVRPKLGTVDGDRVEVLSGLSEGDVVAVTGVSNLADGAQVKVAEGGPSALSSDERRF